jgi:hypothetical protein
LMSVMKRDGDVMGIANAFDIFVRLREDNPPGIFGVSNYDRSPERELQRVVNLAESQ